MHSTAQHTWHFCCSGTKTLSKLLPCLTRHVHSTETEKSTLHVHCMIRAPFSHLQVNHVHEKETLWFLTWQNMIRLVESKGNFRYFFFYGALESGAVIPDFGSMWASGAHKLWSSFGGPSTWERGSALFCYCNVQGIGGGCLGGGGGAFSRFLTVVDFKPYFRFLIARSGTLTTPCWSRTL